ncbi:MAG: carboxylesterase family protein [Porticoccaceae bacterium]
MLKPPVGDLRWRAPRPLDRPRRIISPKDDTACVQKASVYAGATGKGIVGSEDCLYLDITAPD